MRFRVVKFYHRAATGRHPISAQSGPTRKGPGMGSGEAVYDVPRQLLKKLFDALQLEQLPPPLRRRRAFVLQLLSAAMANTEEPAQDLQFQTADRAATVACLQAGVMEVRGTTAPRGARDPWRTWEPQRRTILCAAVEDSAAMAAQLADRSFKVQELSLEGEEL